MFGYKYYETSAKTGTNVDLMFKQGLEEVCDYITKNKNDPNFKLGRLGISQVA